MISRFSQKVSETFLKYNGNEEFSNFHLSHIPLILNVLQPLRDMFATNKLHKNYIVNQFQTLK